MSVTDIINSMKEECARDVAQAQVRQAMAELLGYTVAQLEAQGFSPELTLTPYGMIELRFDPDRIDRPEDR